jgi:hypothetical protein
MLTENENAERPGSAGLTANLHSEEDSTLTWALAYAAAGLLVFPCKPDKSPLTGHGLLDALTDREMIRDWWRRWPWALVAIAVPAGYAVVDVDGGEGWAALAGAGLTLPGTLTATTGRGPLHKHLWYTLPAGVQLRNKVALVPHVDIRALGAYVIVPPSRTVHGPYSWAGRFDLGDVSDCPEWVIESAGRTETKAATPASEWRELVSGVAEGQRNNAVVRLVGHLLRRYVDPILALELVRCWNSCRCTPPLPDDEVMRTVDSIARLELRRQGGAA